MASTTSTRKHLIPFAWIGGKIADSFSRLASRVNRGRDAPDSEGAPTVDAVPASAQGATDTLAQAVAHLEYLGYEVDPPEPDGWSFARHPLRYDFHLRAFPWGIRLHCAVRTDLAVGKSRLEWLEYLNTANERSRITHFSLFEGPWGTYDVRMSAFASVPYSREAFAIVTDMWHDDLDWIRRKRDLPVRTAVETEEEEEEEAVTLH
jgi:hypothetical protein